MLLAMVLFRMIWLSISNYPMVQCCLEVITNSKSNPSKVKKNIKFVSIIKIVVEFSMTQMDENDWIRMIQQLLSVFQQNTVIVLVCATTTTTLFSPMNWSSDSASSVLYEHLSYLNCSVLSLNWMVSIMMQLFLFEYLVEWVMECLSQIQSTISTL